MERPSRSAIFRSKMKLQREKEDKEQKNKKQQPVPTHRRIIGNKESKTR